MVLVNTWDLAKCRIVLAIRSLFHLFFLVWKNRITDMQGLDQKEGDSSKHTTSITHEGIQTTSIIHTI